MQDDPYDLPAGPRRGQLPFALALCAAALLLLASFPSQTAPAPDADLVARPGFWPGVAVLTMAVCSAIYALRWRRRRITREDRAELFLWLRACEYVGWFLVYVLLVPVIGYLVATVIFLPALTWRLGYRSRKILWISGALGVAIVLLFKTMLSVRIPGGAIYEWLPGAARSFFILNF